MEFMILVLLALMDTIKIMMARFATNATLIAQHAVDHIWINALNVNQLMVIKHM